MSCRPAKEHARLMGNSNCALTFISVCVPGVEKRVTVYDGNIEPREDIDQDLFQRMRRQQHDPNSTQDPNRKRNDEKEGEGKSLSSTFSSYIIRMPLAPGTVRCIYS